MSSPRDAISTLFRYQLTSDLPVGKGGCGQVWRALDTLFDRPVAIKTIGESLLEGEPEVAKRTFIREALAGARLSALCVHIVRVFDIGIVQNVPFFVMEWLEPETSGGRVDISDLIGNCGLAKAKTIIFQIADAVRVAHQKGIVHSDIAPWNIVYSPEDRIYKLADFGLLKIVEENLISKGSGSLLRGGRQDFLPSEAILDFRLINFSCDIHALAVTLGVLLSGDTFLRSRRGLQRFTPPVIRVAKEQRDAPDQVRQLLHRFVDNHTGNDEINEFIVMLQRIPN